MKEAITDKKKDLGDEVVANKQQNTDAQIDINKKLTDEELAAFGQLSGALSTLAGENKELAAAEAIIQTYLGANKALGQGGIFGIVTAATVIATGLANVKKIYDTKLPVSSGGGGSVPSVGSTISSNVPRQATLSDVATSIGQRNEQPVRAYVIGQDVTDSQEAQSYLNNQKTL